MNYIVNLSSVTQIRIFSSASLLCLHFLVGSAAASHLDDRKPETSLVYYNYHWLFADRSYHYTNTAGLSNHSVVEINLSKAAPTLRGYEGDSLIFDSYAYISRIQSLKWLIDPYKLTAQHVYDDPNDIKLAAGPQVDQHLCGLQLDYMLHKVNKHNHHITNSTNWSIFNIINSFGSPTFGLASGNTMFLGDYKACTSYKLSITKNKLVEVNETQAERFFTNKQPHTSDSRARKVLKFVKKYIAPFVGITETVYDSYDAIQEYQDKIRLQPTVYCVAGIRWPSWPNSTYHKRNVVFRVGVCLPDTCDSSSLDLYGDKIKRLMDIQIPDYYSGYYINNLYCLPDERSPLRDPMQYKSTVLFLAFNAVWIVLIASATVAVYLRSKKSNRDDSKENNDESTWFAYLKCWCLVSNYDTFLRVGGERKLEIECEDVSNGKEAAVKNIVDLSPLDGLKMIGLFTIVSVHTIMSITSTGWNNAECLHSLSTSVLSASMPLFGTSVNLFFVITGVLTSVRLLQLSEQLLMKPLFWLQFFINRYLRIVPLYLYVNWAIRSYGRFLSFGPLWDYGTSESGWEKRCQSESMWDLTLLKTNLDSPLNHCNAIGWYLVSDIQFSFLTPIFIILFLKKPLVGHSMVFVTSLAATVNLCIRYKSFTPLTDGSLEYVFVSNYTLNDGAHLYVQPQYRFTAYLVGLSAGHLLLQYGRGRIKKWPNWFTSFGKMYICLVFYVIIFAGSLKFVLLPENQPLLHFLGAIVAGSYHWLTSSALAVFVMLICTGSFPKASSLLSRNSVRVLSAAILSPVLIHLLVLANLRALPQNLPRISNLQLNIINIFAILLSILFGSCLHVMYELPMKRFLYKSVNKLLGANKKSTPKHNTYPYKAHHSKQALLNEAEAKKMIPR